jgi:hypothetical protein
LRAYAVRLPSFFLWLLPSHRRSVLWGSESLLFFGCLCTSSVGSLALAPLPQRHARRRSRIPTCSSHMRLNKTLSWRCVKVSQAPMRQRCAACLVARRRAAGRITTGCWSVRREPPHLKDPPKTNPYQTPTTLYTLTKQLLDTLFGARGSNAPPPLSLTVVDALACRAAGLGDGDCAVCLEPSVPAQPVTELPCAHVFHAACIKKWLSTSGACPVCRLVL